MIAIGPLVPAVKVKVMPARANSAGAYVTAQGFVGDRIFDAAPISRSLEPSAAKMDPIFAVSSIVLSADSPSATEHVTAIPVATPALQK